MKTALLVWLCVWNIVAFFLMGADKRRAKKGTWRIPERTLFLSALLGGSVGAILGMQVFHHKTKHRIFRIGMPCILLLQFAAAAAVFYQITFVR